MSVPKKEEASYSVSAAARKLDMSVGMLREYERRGLIKPRRNPANNYRLFSETDMEWIRCLRELIHQQGLSIKGIQRLLTVMPCWKIKDCSESRREKCRVFSKRRPRGWSSAGKKVADVVASIRAAGSSLNPLRE